MTPPAGGAPSLVPDPGQQALISLGKAGATVPCRMLQVSIHGAAAAAVDTAATNAARMTTTTTSTTDAAVAADDSLKAARNTSLFKEICKGGVMVLARRSMHGLFSRQHFPRPFAYATPR